MKSPWDDDDGTVVIHEEEVTEMAEAPKTHARPESKAKGTRRTPREIKDEATTRQEMNEALDEVIGNLGESQVDEFTSSLESKDMTASRQMTLGDILKSTTGITEEQLQEASDIVSSHGNEGERLGDVLVRKKFLSEDDLIYALSLQFNVSLAEDLNKVEIDPDLIGKIPINFAKKHGMVPLYKKKGKIIVAISDPSDLSALDDVRMLLRCNVKPKLAKKSSITDTINRLYDRANQEHEDLMEDLEEQSIDSMALPEPQDLLDSEDEAPIIRLVNTLLFRAVKERASDIHIEPLEKELAVRFRIDGVLYEIMRPPKRAQASITSRIKIMADLDIAEKFIPQDGRIKIKIAGRNVDIRVSILPTAIGPSIVMRLLDTSNVLLDLPDLGFTKVQLKTVDRIIHKAHGIFLVTGPTGSGKTTTLYSCLSKINSRERKIITVEDPVEIQLSGVNQINVNPKVDLTFAAGLRSILRQDPDVIMVGEIRDRETADIAIRASLTGHLVFSTLHTNDAASSITRLVDMGLEPFLVSSSLEGIMAQRLIRKLCTTCKEAYEPTARELAEVGITPEQAKGKHFFRPVGCNTCWSTGYKSRTGIYEILVIDDEMKSLILKNSDGNTLKAAAIKKGMRTLRDDGALKVLSGETSLEEILRVTQSGALVE